MKPGLRCAAIEAPDDYAALLGASLPFDTSLEEETYDLLHFFAPSALALEHALRVLEPRLATDGMLWVSWPKKSSGVATDLDEAVVRATGLATGLVDVKVCAVDATWSALKFVRRLRDR